MMTATELNNSILKKMEQEGYSQEDLKLVAEYLSNPSFDNRTKVRKISPPTRK